MQCYSIVILCNILYMAYVYTEVAYLWMGRSHVLPFGICH